MNRRWAWQLNAGSIPSATKATGTALGPRHAHVRRAAAPTGRITALSSKKQEETKTKIAVDGTCLIMRLVTKSPPHSIQRGVWPGVRCLRTRVQRRLVGPEIAHSPPPEPSPHHIRPRKQNTLTRSGGQKYAKLPTESEEGVPLHIQKLRNLVYPSSASTPSKCVISRRNRRLKSSDPDASPAMALDTSCPLPRPSRCGHPCSRTKTSGRRLTSRPTLNVLSRRSYAPRCLRQSCGQLPRLLDPRYPLGGAFSHTSTGCGSPTSTSAVPPAAVVVIATLTIFATTPTVAVPVVATVAALLFPPVSFGQRFLRGSAKM